MRTTMEIYDFEFSFRLDVGAVAHQHLTDPTVDLLVVPLRSGECEECPWREHCSEALLAGSGDPSLLPGVGYREWAILRAGDVFDRAGVAALTYETAKLIAAGVDLDRIRAEASGLSADASVADLIPRAKKQRATLESAGIVTVADLEARIDPGTAALAAGSFLPEAILNARAVTGEARVYRRPDTTGAIPRSDIEIDIDMENTNDGTYLWGTLVTDRDATGIVDEGFRAFVSWEPVRDDVELALFVEFWTWLTSVLRRADAAGSTVTVYCWHESAENTQMRRIAANDPDLAEAVERFIVSSTWVDMRKVFEHSWITGESTGLKVVAPLAGYEWPVVDAGGGLSMVRHAEATAPDADIDAQSWLLDYNRGDVEATLAIREWLDAEATSWPEVRTD